MAIQFANKPKMLCAEWPSGLGEKEENKCWFYWLTSKGLCTRQSLCRPSPKCRERTAGVIGQWTAGIIGQWTAGVIGQWTAGVIWAMDSRRYWTMDSRRHWTMDSRRHWAMDRGRYWATDSRRYWTMDSRHHWTMDSSRYWATDSRRYWTMDSRRHWTMDSRFWTNLNLVCWAKFFLSPPLPRDVEKTSMSIHLKMSNLNLGKRCTCSPSFEQTGIPLTQVCFGWKWTIYCSGEQDANGPISIRTLRLGWTIKVSII